LPGRRAKLEPEPAGGSVRARAGRRARGRLPRPRADAAHREGGLNLQPDGAAQRCREAAARLAAENAVERIWAGDASFWRPEALARKRIEASLGWLTLPERMEAALPDLEGLAEELRGEADRVLVIGTGGAALPAWVLAGAFGPREGWPRLSTIDTTEPSDVAAAIAGHDPARTLFVVSSRTGATLETNLLFDVLYDHAESALGGEAGRRFLVVTEPGSALATEAARRKARGVFPVEAGAPGEFGALSRFGLLPAALAGIPVGDLLERARRMAEACRAAGPANPGLFLGAALGAEALAGRDKLTLSIGGPAGRLGAWIDALLSGATGKDGRGIVAVDGEALGPPGAYGADRFFVRIATADAEDTAAEHRLATLVEHGNPLAGFVLRDALDLGAELFRWEFAAVAAARLLGVDPFDETDARDARDRANRILAGGAPDPPVAAAASGDAFAALLASLRPGDQFAISAYLPERPEVAAALASLRLAVRDGKRVATTAGFGPRRQQAAGQLQAGGGPRLAFLQLTCAPGEPVPIPGRPWDFGAAFAAQADGELEALAARGQRVARVRLGADLEKGIADLTAAVGRGGTS